MAAKVAVSGANFAVAESGTLLVVEAADLEAINEFIFDDPYSRAGLFSNVVVRPWAWSLGAPQDAVPAEEST